MAKVFREIIKGLLFRGETSDPSDNVNGSLWYNTTSNEIKGYLDSAIRTIASTDQVQTFQNKTIDGTTGGNNTVTADANNIVFDNTTSGLTAADLQAAVDEVEGRVDTVESSVTGKADTDLNNLAATSINQDLLSDGDNTRDLGAAGNRFAEIHGVAITANSLASDPVITVQRAGTSRGILGVGISTPSGDTAAFSIQQPDTTNRNLIIHTAIESTVDAVNTGDISLETGNKDGVGATGDSGNINFINGTVDSGERGFVKAFTSGVISINPDTNIGLFSGQRSLSGAGDTDQTIFQTGTIGGTATGNTGGAVFRSGHITDTGDGNTGIATFRSGDIDNNASNGSTGQVTIRSGDIDNASGGSGGSGDVVIRPGTVNGGTRGGVILLDGIATPVADRVWTAVDATGKGQWKAPSSGAPIFTKQIFTASGTWTKPVGCTNVLVEVIGGGGGGGGGGATGASQNNASAGGGGAGYAKKLIDVTAISSETVTVGAGGSGGSDASGSNGVDSSFGAHCTGQKGFGGNGGATGGTDFILNFSSAAGTGVSGDINISGQLGGNATQFASGGIALCGKGGDSQLGSGGASQGTTGVTKTGAVGQGYGAGGGGGCAGPSQGANNVGGAGTDGIVIVWEYYN